MTTKTPKALFTIYRKDSPNYGYVISQHADIDAADRAYAKILRRYPQGTLPHLMFVIREAPKMKKGTRARF